MPAYISGVLWSLHIGSGMQNWLDLLVTDGSGMQNWLDLLVTDGYMMVPLGYYCWDLYNLLTSVLFGCHIC